MKLSSKNFQTRAVYTRLLGYVKPYWLVFLVGMLASLLYAGIDAGVTYLLKPLMDEGFIDRNRAFIQMVPFIIMIAFLSRGSASFLSFYCMTWVARNVVMVLRQQLFDRLLRLPARFFDHHASGQLLSKIIYDAEQVSQVSTEALTTLVQSTGMVIGLFIVMFSISWPLTLLYLLVVPVIAFIVRYTNVRIRRVSFQAQQAMGQVTEVAQETIDAYQVVRIFGGQPDQRDKFGEASVYSRHCDMKAAKNKAINIATVQMVAGMGISFIIYLAISPHTLTALTAGGFAAMLASMLALLKPLKNLSTVNGVIQRGLAGAQSIFKLLDESLESDQGIQPSHPLKGNICFDHVSFHYKTEQLPVLKDINLQIASGEKVAFVGRSGSGKTTLINLLARFYDIQSGSIQIDGQDIQDLSIDSVRSNIAFVSQGVTLFNDTIANNIAYGQLKTADRSEIERAATAAHVMEFARTLPDGLDTQVGERGGLLSGGQRQRVALARALLKKSAILILDEATSALDSESEHYIQLAMQTAMKDRTTLIIAHRLSTIENADRIVFIDKGEILEQGTHQELLAKQGDYARLYQMQFKKASDRTE